MFHYPPRSNRPDLKTTRRALRQIAPAAEEILWRYLRNGQLRYKFRRQFDIQSFVADFYCHVLRLVIELDGWTHDSEKTKRRDLIKQQVLERMGCKVIRFTNEQVYGDIGKVLDEITAVCESRAREIGTV